MPCSRAARFAAQAHTYTSPSRGPRGGRRANASTSVGRSSPLYRALSRRIPSRPTKVTDTTARRRSARSTARTTRRTTGAGSGSRRPCTLTSGPLGGLEFRTDAAARTGIADPVMVHAGHGPAEHVLDLVDVAESDRSLLQLPRTQLLADQLLDRAADGFGLPVLEHPDGRLRRIRQHGNRGLGRLGTGPGIAEVADVDRDRRRAAAGPVQ